jgi:hypothetical protein
MKENCEDCPDVAECLEICEKIKPLLEELPKYSPEKSESQFNEKLGDIENVSGDKSGIDRFRRINPASVYEDTTDTEIDWESTQPQPEAVEMEKVERKQLRDAIIIATRREDLKLNRRFQSFLKCEKIVQIAARSGTTKQNIQKRFQLVIHKVYRIISKSYKAKKAAITPLKFKKKVNLSDV